jgi:hypothetical protein
MEGAPVVVDGTAESVAPARTQATTRLAAPAGGYDAHTRMCTAHIATFGGVVKRVSTRRVAARLTSGSALCGRREGRAR